MFQSSFYALLRKCCLATTKSIFATLPRYSFKIVQCSKGRKYAFRPGPLATSPLLVCHADTVVQKGNGTHGYTRKGLDVTSIALDDRLGLAMLLYSIRYHPDTLGACAMLVCDDEETGNSTAQEFSEDIRPNWLMEFDRRGTDCVTYDYSSPLWDGILSSIGFKVGQGTFSDICYLDLYGVCGVNVGVGYHNEHSPACHANLADTWIQYMLAEKLWRKMHDIRLTYSPDTYSRFGRYSGLAGGYADDNPWDKGYPDDMDGSWSQDGEWIPRIL